MRGDRRDRHIVAIRAIDAEHTRDAEPNPKTAGWTTPEEIVATFRFLASDAAGRVNGARTRSTARPEERAVRHGPIVTPASQGYLAPGVRSWLATR